MVQRPCPDLRGGCAAMRIPTATGGEGLGNDPSYPAPSSSLGPQVSVRSVIGLLRNPRLAANLLDARSFLRLAQNERNLLFAGIRPLHGSLPGWSPKT